MFEVRKRTIALGVLVSGAAVALVPFFSTPAFALVGAHSYTNNSTGDVFLGGDYIELGISKYGSFGSSTGQALPPGFYGTSVRNNIGMSTNPSGFGVAPDLRMDYFLPGNPEERWSVGYTIGGTQTTGSNAFLNGSTDIANYSVTNQSSGSDLKATGSGTFDNNLQITQVTSFNASDAYFLNTVTLKNVGSSTLNSVRYMRSVDPDNTHDQGGSFTTHNEILDTFAAGDGKAVVMADTSNNNSDPVYLANGSRSPLIYYSNDPSAVVSTYGTQDNNPYTSQLYATAPAKGYSINADQDISIDFDVGTLAPGQSQTVSYYTSLDNQDFNTVLDKLNTQSSTDQTATFNNAYHSGTIVLSTPNNTTITCSNAVTEASQTKQDKGYSYPLGLVDLCLTTPDSSNQVTLTFVTGLKPSQVVARDFNTATGKYTDVQGAVITQTTYNGQPALKLTFNLADNGSLDSNATTGAITDPIGLAVTNNATTASTPNTGFGAPTKTNPLIIWAGLTATALLGLGLRLSRREKI